MRQLSSFLSVFLALQPLCAQNTNEPKPLEIHVVDRPGAALVNSVSASGFAVQVTDSNGVPVVGAAVALRLPDQGATGFFADGLRAHVAYTDANGKVKFGSIHWNDTAGKVELRVTAAKSSAHTGLVLMQDVVTDTTTAVAAALPPQKPSVTVVDVAVQKQPVPPALSLPTVLDAGNLPLQVAAATAPPLRPAPPKPAAPKIVPDPGTMPKALADVAPPSTQTQLPPATTGASAPSGKPTIADVTEPKVSITNSTSGAGSHGNRKMWIILGAVGAGAGVGALLAVSGHGSGTTAATTGVVTIGAPTISVGH